MNRNQLRYFVSAAEHRSFTKAAEQYYISQTAVTQQIQQLEQTLGCELFDRSTRPVSLTSAGKSFLLDAKAILERMSRAQERVHDAATGLTGTLRVGYVRGYERSDLSVLMRHFHQKNGNVLITFYRCSTDVLAAGLLHQEYDIVFTWDSTNLRTQEGVTFQTVEKARLVVALYAGHPLTQRRQLTRQELRGENILYMSPDAAPDSYGDAFFMQRYAEAGYKPNILFRSADTESILMMVAAEEGISLLPDYCTDRLYNADNLVFVPLVGEGEEEEIIAAWQSGNQNPALGRFLTELNQKAQDRVKRWKIFLYRDRQTFCIEKAVDGCRGRGQSIRRVENTFLRRRGTGRDHIPLYRERRRAASEQAKQNGVHKKVADLP